jgi:hypothetical protein
MTAVLAKHTPDHRNDDRRPLHRNDDDYTQEFSRYHLSDQTRIIENTAKHRQNYFRLDTLRADAYLCVIAGHVAPG